MAAYRKTLMTTDDWCHHMLDSWGWHLRNGMRESNTVPPETAKPSSIYSWYRPGYQSWSISRDIDNDYGEALAEKVKEYNVDMMQLKSANHNYNLLLHYYVNGYTHRAIGILIEKHHRTAQRRLNQVRREIWPYLSKVE